MTVNIHAMALSTHILAFLDSEQQTDALRNMVTAMKAWIRVIAMWIADKTITNGTFLFWRLLKLVVHTKVMTAESRKDGTRQRNPKYAAKSASSSLFRNVNPMDAK
ncbi:hypothetical protein ABBQ38_004062 [Trebouxia sp. C0009 RCD-2024]